MMVIAIIRGRGGNVNRQCGGVFHPQFAVLTADCAALRHDPCADGKAHALFLRLFAVDRRQAGVHIVRSEVGGRFTGQKEGIRAVRVQLAAELAAYGERKKELLTAGGRHAVGHDLIRIGEERFL